MFSLVIFTLMIFAILNNLGNVIEEEPDLVSGGFDIRTVIEPELPIDDPADVIAASDGQLSVSDFTLITAQARLGWRHGRTGSMTWVSNGLGSVHRTRHGSRTTGLS
jgi:hypothetical protein